MRQFIIGFVCATVLFSGIRSAATGEGADEEDALRERLVGLEQRLAVMDARDESHEARMRWLYGQIEYEGQSAGVARLWIDYFCKVSKPGRTARTNAGSDASDIAKQLFEMSEKDRKAWVKARGRYEDARGALEK